MCDFCRGDFKKIKCVRGPYFWLGTLWYWLLQGMEECSEPSGYLGFAEGAQENEIPDAWAHAHAQRASNISLPWAGGWENYLCVCVGGWLLSGVFTAKFGLGWCTRYAASVRYTYKKDDGKSLRILFLPNLTIYFMILKYYSNFSLKQKSLKIFS
jgi:hypothetical protein